ncbi:REP-associated tyrosine transposase [Labrys sp. ZIDIC5]|uniref:REP-associated tyrosine transposase n=1 Tax=Labrys sedimenti TaxID=3106036 RepID=UPI002ACA8D8C|nr:transposase [Labrys sp. ZIDIC5]MDZ5451869.1 transposase [Labrys sp. ZIDIC5]
MTFRLLDSLPANAIGRHNSSAENRRRLDHLLDEGIGACWLGQPEIGELVEDALLAFDQARYRLWAWCIVPNHVQCLFETIEGARLGDIVKSWKAYTGAKANRVLGRQGPFWQRDYFDRYMRNQEQFARAIDYIERNPVAAGLCRQPSDWRWSSAFRRH